MRIALFITCFNDTLFPATGRATVELLERLGHQVEFPEEQTCCGQIHSNTGYQLEALPLVYRFLKTFRDAEVVVSPSASCVAMVRDQYPRLAALAGDAALEREVRQLAPRVLDMSELIVDRLGIVDVGATFAHRVAFHPTCHSTRLLHIGDRPLRLLRAVRGLELVAFPDADQCCGFGGTFAVKNADVSTAMLADKLHHLRESGAQVCVAVDNSCLMQIGGGLRRAGSPIRVMHLVEVLNSSEMPETDTEVARV
ncbi:MAG: (Fe-S)-binding protein [Gaiellaceae bacterium]